MADKAINELVQAEQLNSDGLLPVYQNGQAEKISGEMLAAFAQAAASADVQRAVDAADAAEAAAAITGHPPQANPDTGFWQTWNPETGQYEDTVIQAEGPVGPPGETITDIQRTSGTGAAGTTDTYTITLSSGTTFTFTVYNGADGLGSGDMLKSIYDTQNKNTDIFTYCDAKVQEAIGTAIGGAY